MIRTNKIIRTTFTDLLKGIFFNVEIDCEMLDVKVIKVWTPMNCKISKKQQFICLHSIRALIKNGLTGKTLFLRPIFSTKENRNVNCATVFSLLLHSFARKGFTFSCVLPSYLFSPEHSFSHVVLLANVLLKSIFQTLDILRNLHFSHEAMHH